MSLTGAMQIARSGLTAAQLGIQLTGNNIANVGTPGYSRQTASLIPQRGDGNSAWIGAGVLVRDIRRQVDGALQSRLWGSTSDFAAAQTRHNMLSQVEAALGELGDNDLSSELSGFFRVWSERANQTRSSAAVIQQGDKLAEFVRRLRSDLVDQRRQGDAQLGAGVERANQLLSEVAQVNRAISDAEIGGQTANTLRDQRDQLVTELSTLLDVTLVDRGSEGVDVLVGSTPVVLGGTSRGLELRRQNVNGESTLSLATRIDGTQLTPSSGLVGGLLASRTQTLDATIETLDSLAGQLIYEVNKLHATAANTTLLRQTSGYVKLQSSERGLALNDPANQTMANLPFTPVNGGFLVHVRETGSTSMRSIRINIDLDGINAAGSSGYGDDTSLEDIRDAINAIAGVGASITPDGRLSVAADDGFEFGFAEDTSGVLAALGVNAYFTGTDASDIRVRQDMLNDSSLLMTGRIVDGTLVENAAALDVAALQDQALASLNGRTLPGVWRDAASAVGTRVAAARTAAQAAGVVMESLNAQRDAVSGVSIDEESINLISFQRQYQGSAKVISVADELTQTLLSLI